MPTEIAWADETWNPTVGCSRVSPGCDHCYAVRVAAREMQPAHVGLTVRGESGDGHVGVPGSASDGHVVDHAGEQTHSTPRGSLDWTGEVRLLPDRLDTPLRWRKPRRVFVDSMSDLFHPDVPDEFIARVFGTMCAAEHHTFQVLTKRTQRMAALLGGDWMQWYVNQELGFTRAYSTWPLPNVWLGTSVENQRYADIRIPHLLATTAAVRFLSIEPLLGPVDLSGYVDPDWVGGPGGGSGAPHPLVDWVIVGGESGPGARPMHPDWVRSIRDQCAGSGVPFFLKQWGAWVPTGCPISVDCAGQGDIVYAEDGSKWPDGDLAGCQRWWSWDHDERREHTWPDGSTAVRVGPKVSGNMLDGQVYEEYPS